MITYQEFTLTSDCQLVAGPIESLPESALSTSVPNTSSGNFGSTGDQLPAGDGVSPDATGSGCCWGAYAVQRTYDQGGIPGSILLNEYSTQITYNKCYGGFCSPYLRTWHAQDAGRWHPEYTSAGPGWFPNCCDHFLGAVSGGLGYTWVTVRGHQGYSYRGVFDTSGNDYYNSYTNNLTGNADGTWSCSTSYYWKKSFAFKLQAWCGTGSYN